MLHSIFRSHDRFSVISVILLERRFRGNQSILMHIARPIYLWRDLFDGGMRILCSWQFFSSLRCDQSSLYRRLYIHEVPIHN